MRKRPLKNRQALKKKCYGKGDLETCTLRFDIAFCLTEKTLKYNDFLDVTRSFLKVGRPRSGNSSPWTT